MPTAAHAAWDDCVHGTFCVFMHTEGEYILVSYGGEQYHDYRNAWFNDEASSVWNRSQWHVDLYRHSDLEGHMRRLTPYGPPINLPKNENELLNENDVLSGVWVW